MRVFLREDLASSQSIGGGHTEQGASPPPLSFREEAAPRGAAPSKLKGEDKLFRLFLWIKPNENLGL